MCNVGNDPAAERVIGESLLVNIYAGIMPNTAKKASIAGIHLDLVPHLLRAVEKYIF